MAKRVSSLQEFFAKGLDDFHEDEDIDGALKKLNLAAIDDKLPGLVITLMPHQVMGVAFMLQKERDIKSKGGLMCDAMGLGKVSNS
jgi:SNF2 family DNA or RNA helicase